MLTVAASTTTPFGVSDSEPGSEGTLDSGLFASLFNELTGEVEVSDKVSSWLRNVSEGEGEFPQLESEQSINQLLNWLKQQQENGKPLPPELNIEPEALEKAQSILSLLAEYAESESVSAGNELPQAEETSTAAVKELTKESESFLADEPKQELLHPLNQPKRESDDQTPRIKIDGSEPVRTQVQVNEAIVASSKVKPQTQQAPLVEGAKDFEPVAKAPLSSIELEVEAEPGSSPKLVTGPSQSKFEQVMARTEFAQPQQPEASTKTAPELKISAIQPESKDLAQQTTSLGGVALKQAASLAGVEQGQTQEKSAAKGQAESTVATPKQLQAEPTQLQVKTNLDSNTVSEDTSAPEQVAVVGSLKSTKPSSILMPPPAEHQLKRVVRALDKSSKEGEQKVAITSNRSQVQSIGGQSLEPLQESEPEFKEGLKTNIAATPTEPKPTVAESQPLKAEPVKAGVNTTSFTASAELDPVVGESQPIKPEQTKDAAPERTLVLRKGEAQSLEPQMAKAPRVEPRMEQRVVSTPVSDVTSLQAELDAEAEEAPDLTAPKSMANPSALLATSSNKESGKAVAPVTSSEASKSAATIESTQARALASAQTQEQIEFEVAQEQEGLVKSAEQSVAHESFSRERQERLNLMRRTLGGLAGLNASVNSTEPNTLNQNLTPSTQTQAPAAPTQAAEAQSFAQQLAQSQERLQILQEKMAPLLGQRLMMMMDQKVQQAEIRLDPPELGSLMVRVQVNQDNQAQVSFVAQNPQARDALEQAIPRLREMFQQQQMDLVDANVSYQQRGHGEQQGQEESASGQPGQAESLEELAEVPISTQSEQIILQAGKVDFYA